MKALAIVVHVLALNIVIDVFNLSTESIFIVVSSLILANQFIIEDKLNK